MIHSENDYAFLGASSNRYIDVVKYLVELTPNEELKENMVHSDNDCAFRLASTNGHIEVIKYLLELTPNTEKKKE